MLALFALLVGTQADRISSIAEMVAPPPVIDGRQIVADEPVWRAAPGESVESIVSEPSGSILVTILFKGEIRRISPKGTAAIIARLPGFAAGDPGFVGLARAADGSIFVSFRRKSESGIWRIGRDGHGALFTALPVGASPNGIALDGHGGIIVADIVRGLWRVSLRDRTVSRWYAGPLATRRKNGMLPAANGAQRSGSTIYFTNSDRALLVAIAVGRDGRAGAARIVASGIPGDDFALADDGTAYVTTHPFDQLVEVSPSGRRLLIAGRAQGMTGATSATIVRKEGQRWLYVTTDGGLFGGTPTAQQSPGVVRLRLDGR